MNGTKSLCGILYAIAYDSFLGFDALRGIECFWVHAQHQYLGVQFQFVGYIGLLSRGGICGSVLGACVMDYIELQLR